MIHLLMVVLIVTGGEQNVMYPPPNGDDCGVCGQNPHRH